MLQTNRSWTRWMAAGILGLAIAAPAVTLAEQPGAGQEQKEKKPKADRPPRGDEGQRIEHLRNAVLSLDGLTDEQKTSLDTIFNKAAEDFKTMRQQWEENNTQPEQRRAEARAFLKKLHDDVAQVLTPEQRKQLKEKLKERMEERHDGRKPDRPRGPKGDRPRGPKPDKAPQPEQ